MWFSRRRFRTRDELMFHRDTLIDDYVASGMDRRAAERRVFLEFGNVAAIEETSRDVRGRWLDDVVRDLAYALRTLRAAPASTTTAVLSLALGLGASAAVFTLLDAILIRKLPVARPDELAIARWGASKDLDLNFFYASGGGDGHGGWTRNAFSWPAYAGIRDRSQGFSAVMAFSPTGPLNVATTGRATSTGGMFVSGNYFSGLGVAPRLGRFIGADDDVVDGVPAAVISHRLWERELNRSSAVIGESIHLNGRAAVIVGVMPRKFFGVSAGGFLRTPNVDVMVPIRAKPLFEPAGGSRKDWFASSEFWIQIIGRLRAPEMQTTAQHEVAAIVYGELPQDARDQLGTEAPRVWLDAGNRGLDSLRRTYANPLLTVAIVVAAVLAMTCANVAGLLLLRGLSRRPEIALRLALGASRGRVVRQLLVEGLLLSLLGAAGALVIAFWALRVLVDTVATGPAPIPIDVTLDARVLGFTAAVAVMTTLVFALVPAVRVTAGDVSSSLIKGIVTGARGIRGARILVTAQVTVAVVLVAGALLLTRTVANLRSVPLGFDAAGVVLFDVAAGRNGYDETTGGQLYRDILDRLDRTPGVENASLATERLISGLMSNGSIAVEGGSSNAPARTTFNFVGPNFFDVMRLPIVLGRGIGPAEMAALPRVAVINETTARRYFQGESPLGRRFRWGSKREWDVVVIGVAKDAHYDRLRGDLPATVYVPYTQRPFGWPATVSFAVRTARPTPEVVGDIRKAVAGADGRLPLTNVRTQQEQIDVVLTQERLFASLLAACGTLTLVLACVGLFGFLAHQVVSRTREIGVRMALGASHTAIVRIVLRQVAMTLAVGLIVGLPATWMLARTVESQLYGVTTHDAMSFGVAASVVSGVSLLAALRPLRWAARVNPILALRHE